MPYDISPAMAAALAREARKARRELQGRLRFPEPFLPPVVNLESFRVVIDDQPYTFLSKESARKMRDTLNGMTLEGEL